MAPTSFGMSWPILAYLGLSWPHCLSLMNRVTWFGYRRIRPMLLGPWPNTHHLQCRLANKSSWQRRCHDYGDLVKGVCKTALGLKPSSTSHKWPWNDHGMTTDDSSFFVAFWSFDQALHANLQTHWAWQIRTSIKKAVPWLLPENDSLIA